MAENVNLITDANAIAFTLRARAVADAFQALAESARKLRAEWNARFADDSEMPLVKYATDIVADNTPGNGYMQVTGGDVTNVVQLAGDFLEFVGDDRIRCITRAGGNGRSSI